MAGAAKSRGGPGSSKSKSPSQASMPQQYDGNDSQTKSVASDPRRGALFIDRSPIEELMATYRGVEMNWRGWAILEGFDAPKGVLRKNVNSVGRKIPIEINCFKAEIRDVEEIYQYDVAFTPPVNLRKVTEKLWNSKAMQDALRRKPWIYDNNKLAWFTEKKDSNTLTVDVDLNVEEGRTKPRDEAQETYAVLSPEDKAKRNQKFKVHVTYAKTVSFIPLKKALAGEKKVDLKEVGEAINILDHVIHQHARTRCVQFRKAFYPKNVHVERAPLMGGVEVGKGVFASFRMAFMGYGSSIPVSLSVNADSSNCCFWSTTRLDVLLLYLLGCDEGGLLSMYHYQYLKGKDFWARSEMNMKLRRLRNVKVMLLHRQKEGQADRQYSIKEFTFKNAYNSFIPDDSKVNNTVPRGAPGWIEPPDSDVTISEYFQTKWNIFNLKKLPLVRFNNGNVVPVEVCHIIEDQRYIHKLDDRQTSKMITEAVTRPDVRLKGITTGVQLLEWHKDPWLKHYGLKIDSNRMKVNATVLPCPAVTFKNGNQPAKIAQSDRWRIDGKRFIRTNADFPGRTLKSWGICVIDAGRGTAVNINQARNFASNFVRVYKSHGGVVANPDPAVVPGKICEGGEFIATAFNATGRHAKSDPELIFFIVPDKNTDTYSRIKKSCDCRFGVASQVMQASHVMKCQDQYLSNICMKVNAKLGGATSRAVGSTLVMKKLPFLQGTTMIIGADVSHAAPGADSPSIASVTMSLDKEFTRYAAQVENNGARQEVISSSVMKPLIKKMVELWIAANGGRVPQRVLYLRDGVSNEMMNKVIDCEVRDICNALKQRADNKNHKTFFTVIVCTKRHHVRFFPDSGKRSDCDQNGNPLPGTIVETGCTDPTDFDWYCCSHVAIKGTARPMHYHCILDQNECDHEALQQFIFEHSFQYIRSTTPVSMFPAIYYAHLASNRGKVHEDRYSYNSDKKGIAEKIVQGMEVDEAIAKTKAEKVEFMKTQPPPKDPYTTPLLPLINQKTCQLESCMWYV